MKYCSKLLVYNWNSINVKVMNNLNAVLTGVMRNFVFKGFWLIMLLVSLQYTVCGQDGVESAQDLAKKAQNPIANMISLPLQNNTNFGIGPYNRSQNVLNIQPVIPTRISDNWLLVNRMIAPVISQPDVSNESGSTFGLGDIVYQGFFTPNTDGNVTWGVGPVVALPTATDMTLGSGKWSAGPAGIMVASLNKWVLGGVVYNAWSFAGDGDRPSYNQGSLQYFVNYNLPKAYYLTVQPIITVNWNAPDGDKWVVPFGGGAGKVFAIGKQKFNFNTSAYWNAVKPETLDGPDWSVRFLLAFLFPK